MIEGIVLGAIQGVTEWLPISSDGMITLAKVNFFNDGKTLGELIRLALFLHIGTFLAALWYFRKEVWGIFKTVLKYSAADNDSKTLVRFLFVSTLVSGAVGFPLLKAMDAFGNNIELTGKAMTGIVGAMLLLTAFAQLKATKNGEKDAKDLSIGDSVLLGLAQGLSVLPGLSRSGLTVSALLLRKFDDIPALRISFLMSLPAVLGGNIIIGLQDFVFSPTILWGIFFSFLFGILTIHLLMKIAQKIRFGLFVLFFGILTLLSLFF